MNTEELTIARRMFSIMAENLLANAESESVAIREGIAVIDYVYNNTNLQASYHLEILSDSYIILWRRKAWQLHSQKVLEDRKAQEEYNIALDKRKEAFFSVCKSICELLGVKDEAPFNQAVRMLAEKALSKKSGGELLNMDLSKVPDLPTLKPHVVLDERGKKEYTI